jgi:hypothetical protein
MKKFHKTPRQTPDLRRAMVVTLFAVAVMLSLGPGCKKKGIDSPLAPLPLPIATATSTPDGCVIAESVHLTGNLNAAQRADQSGGIIDLSYLPLYIIGGDPKFYNAAKIAPVTYGTSGEAIKQIADFTTPEDTGNIAPHLTQPLITGGFTLFCASHAGNYNWILTTPAPPAATCVKTVTDLGGQTRQLTFQFFQVNDLGQAGINTSPSPQTAWAWYVFETTGGTLPSEYNLLGGSAVVEGYEDLPCSVDHGHTDWLYVGDLLFFNADGSLASQGGSAGPSMTSIGYQVKPSVYLQPLGSYPISRIYLDFGTAGLPGYGKRDGLTGDAAPSAVH